jgi:hypothetical protein
MTDSSLIRAARADRRQFDRELDDIGQSKVTAREGRFREAG